jgi:hypothetical protein
VPQALARDEVCRCQAQKERRVAVCCDVGVPSRAGGRFRRAIAYTRTNRAKRLDSTGAINMKNYTRPAQTKEEWRALLDSDDPTIVRSLEDWQRLLNDATRNPFKGVPPEAIEHFTGSLKFKGGLAHADYSEIGKYLNIFQFRSLWRDNFGIGDKLWIDYNDFKCEGAGTCSVAISKICTSNC